MQNFNYHTHTYRCGHADLIEDEEYIKEYIKMGFKRVAFTDHCPEKEVIDDREKIRMRYEQRKEYLDSIKRLKEKYADKITIESGYEIEYLPGQEANLQELKKETDKLVLGQHFIYDKNKNLRVCGRDSFTKEEIMEYASYVEKAIELGIPDIIVHPDNYIQSRGKFEEDEAKVAHRICKVAEKHGIPIEINLAQVFNATYYKDRVLNDDSIEIQKGRLGSVPYPRKEFWQIASNYDVKVLYGIDAHHKGQINLFNNLVTLANEIIGMETISKLKFAENEIFA
ncbi:MAG: histidinol-phosphatase [Clostridia bacterium]|nr:histidinol-phosphatase [Clostridia bacterium]MCI9275027.1 histidinol-phosphatase [Clostridia bacterium]